MRWRSWLLISTLLICCACSKGNEDHQNNAAGDSIPENATIWQRAAFRWGAAVNAKLLRNNAAYRAIVTREDNSVTPENAMKITRIRSSPDTWNFSDADYIVNYAIENNKRIHGHTLIWYRVPAWLETYQADAAGWEQLFKEYIQTVVSRYKGKVGSWDVVNEAIDDNGNLRDCVWLRNLGADYIARAFQYAHEADPDALLFYNDYGQEQSELKRNASLALINSLISRSVPIHGIGLQMHISKNTSEENLAAAINTAAKTGLQIHISELDIAMNPENNPDLTYNTALAEMQSKKYNFIVKTYNAIPEAQRFGITTWNVTDGDSWIVDAFKRPDWPLPFDKDYKRKAAYRGILEALK